MSTMTMPFVMIPGRASESPGEVSLVAGCSTLSRRMSRSRGYRKIRYWTLQVSLYS